MQISIGKQFQFDAAHRLGLHQGKCSRPHGHTYTLHIEVTGTVETLPSSSQGMVVDYYHITDVVKAQIIDRFDHQDLNVVLKPWFPGRDPEKENVTTAENMAELFFRILQKPLAKWGGNLTKVRLQETPTSYAEVRV